MSGARLLWKMLEAEVKSTPLFLVDDFIAGNSYMVINDFTDYDGTIHAQGEQFIFEEYSYVPYDAGYTLKITKNGEKGILRLEDSEHAQANILKMLYRYIKPVNNEPHELLRNGHQRKTPPLD